VSSGDSAANAGELRVELITEQMTSLLGHVRSAGERLTAQDRLQLAQATALLVDASRVEEGLPTEIGVQRSVTALEDALQMLAEEAEGAEEA
jgi:hypothetical protein